jgi:hypothetical protein
MRYCEPGTIMGPGCTRKIDSWALPIRALTKSEWVLHGNREEELFPTDGRAQAEAQR